MGGIPGNRYVEHEAPRRNRQADVPLAGTFVANRLGQPLGAVDGQPAAPHVPK